MSSPSNAIEPAIQRNQQSRCKAPGCSVPRWRVSGYCRTHGSNFQRLGHPHGTVIRPKDYSVEFATVSSFIDQHESAPQIQAALRWVDSWLNAAHLGDTSIPAYRQLQRLHDHGVTATAVLKASAALFLYSSRFPNRLPSDDRLTFAMSLAVLAMAPREKRQSPSKPSVLNIVRHPAAVRRGIGTRLRSNLHVLFTNMTDAINRQEQEARQQRDDLRQPFSQSTSK